MSSESLAKPCKRRISVHWLGNDPAAVPLVWARGFEDCIQRFLDYQREEASDAAEAWGLIHQEEADGWIVVVDGEVQVGLLTCIRDGSLECPMLGSRRHPRFDGREIAPGEWFDELLDFFHSFAYACGVKSCSIQIRKGFFPYFRPHGYEIKGYLIRRPI